MINIGESIYEAIDWTQDFLATTRPIAECTLFSLLAEKAVEETEEGFVLVEAEDEVEKHHTKIKNNQSKNRIKLKFHNKRKSIGQQNMKRKVMRHLDNSSAAEGMQYGENALTDDAFPF